MDKVKEIKFAVAKSEYELKSSDLIIRDLECKTREVQLLKVKKEMYAALKKKDTRLNEVSEYFKIKITFSKSYRIFRTRLICFDKPQIRGL